MFYNFDLKIVMFRGMVFVVWFSWYGLLSR